MKTKRCTNSSCRREFRLDTLVCPYCGKCYPRESIGCGLQGRYAVVFTYAGVSKLAAIKAIRKYVALGLRDAKEIVDHAPSLITDKLSMPQAKALRAEIRAAGGDAMIVPASRGTKGVFVLPKKAG